MQCNVMQYFITTPLVGLLSDNMVFDFSKTHGCNMLIVDIVIELLYILRGVNYYDVIASIACALASSPCGFDQTT